VIPVVLAFGALVDKLSKYRKNDNLGRMAQYGTP
jgi:hypothetical protein